jgi:hypothetical protein
MKVVDNNKINFKKKKKILILELIKKLKAKELNR